MNAPVNELNARRPWWVLGLPFLAGFLVFIQILWAGWVYDDIELFQLNPKMRDWNTVWHTFTQPYWLITGASEIHTGFYRPVGGAVFVFLHKISGGSPFAFHFASLFLHSICSLLVARLGIQIGLSNLAAVIAGITFAVSGGHVEAVAWASSLPDILAAFFSLLALSSFLKQKLIAPAIWLTLALLSKESAIATLILMLGIAIWAGPKPALLLGLKPNFGSFRGPRILMLLVAAGIVYGARCYAFDAMHAGFGIHITHHLLSASHQVLLSFGLLAQYIGYMFWPWPNYPFQPLQVDIGPSDFALFGPAIVGIVLLISALVLWFWRSRKSLIILIGVGLLFAGLAPVLNTKLIGRYPFEQRFLYLPSLGFALLLGSMLSRVAAKAGRYPMLLSAGVLLGVNLYSTLDATPNWKDEISYFTWTRQTSPNAMTPYLNLARVYLQEAELYPEGHPRRIELAEAAYTEYEDSLKVNPDKWFVVADEREKGNVGMGDALFMVGEYGTAEAIYRETLKGYPRSIYAHVGVAQSLLLRAEKQAMVQPREELLPLWEEALKHTNAAMNGERPLPGAYHSKSVALYFLGRLPEAMEPALESVRLKPDFYPYVIHLAELYFLQQDMPMLQATLQAFLVAAPDTPYRKEVEETLNNIRMESGNPSGN